jgi:hypothetical protein
VFYHIWGGELYSIKKLSRIVICFRFPYCSKKFIWNLKSWKFNSEVIHSCVFYYIWAGELFSIKKLFRIVICFRFPYCSKKFIPNLKSWIFYSEVIHSCVFYHICIASGTFLELSSVLGFLIAQRSSFRI